MLRNSAASITQYTRLCRRVPIPRPRVTVLAGRSGAGGLGSDSATTHISPHSTHSTAFPGRKPQRDTTMPKMTAPKA